MCKSELSFVIGLSGILFDPKFVKIFTSEHCPEAAAGGQAGVQERGLQFPERGICPRNESNRVGALTAPAPLPRRRPDRAGALTTLAP